MLKIFCLYYEGKYSYDYVEKLERGISRNTTIDFEFFCYKPKRKSHWHKLEFFDPSFTGTIDEVVVMDIDQVIVNNIDDMLSYPIKDNELLTYSSAVSTLPINGGFYKFKGNAFTDLTDKWSENKKYWESYYYNNGTVDVKGHGEQNFVFDNVENIITLPDNWMVRYYNDNALNYQMQLDYCELYNKDFMIMDEEIDKDIKVVHFTNDNYIHKCDASWVRKHWV